ncbi:MAG: hypothetical protein HY688_03145 [Chloroflexi bacterium]|nr:hypothetical protein [Chloroflexota bacterium]
MWVITFDIDGTMEFGDPIGIITRGHVQAFRAQGAIIGSASDRPESSQFLMWRASGIEPDFVVLKHRMSEVRELYPDAEAFWHVGDRPLDQMTARQAGFVFFWPDQLPSPEEYLAQAMAGRETLDEADGSPEAGRLNGYGAEEPLKEAALRMAAGALNGHGPAKPGQGENPSAQEKAGDPAPSVSAGYALP